MNNAVSVTDPSVSACYEPMANYMMALIDSMDDKNVSHYLNRGGLTRSRIFNGETGKAYSGMNQILLKLHEIRNGYTDPRWMTRNQIIKAGGEIVQDQEPVTVSFYQFFDSKTGERLPEPQRYFQEVYNVQQCAFPQMMEYYSRPWLYYNEPENFFKIFSKEEICLIEALDKYYQTYKETLNPISAFEKNGHEILKGIIESENAKILPSQSTFQSYQNNSEQKSSEQEQTLTDPVANEAVSDRIYLNTGSSLDWNTALMNGALCDTEADKLYITPDMPVEKFMDYIDPAIFHKAPQPEQTPEQTIEQSAEQSDDVSIEHQSAEKAEPQNDLRAEQSSEQTATDMRALVLKHRKQIETFIKLVTRNQGFVNSVRTKDLNSIKNDFKALAPGLMLSFETHYRDFANDVRDNKDFGEWVQTHVYHIALHEIQNKLLKAKETEKFVNTIPEQAPEFDISEKEKMTKFLAEQMAEMRKSFEESNQKAINEIKASFENHLKTLNAEHEKQLAESRKRESELLARIAELEQQRNEQRTEKKEEPEQAESVSATSAEPEKAESVSATSAEPEKAEQSASYDTAPVEQAEEVKPEQNRTSDVSRSESAPEKEQAFGQFSTITGIGLENFVDRDGAYHNVYTEFINELMNSETVINAVVNADEQNIKLTIEKEFINNVLTSWFEKENSEHKGERFYLGNITEIHDAITNKSGLMNDLLESFYTNITTIYKDSIIDTYNYKHGIADNANTVGKSESERFYQYLNSYINTYVGKSRGDYRFRTWESGKKEQDSAFKFMQDYLTKHFGNYVVESGDVFGNSKRQIDFNDGIVKFRTELKSVVFYRNFLESFLKSDKADIRFERSDNGVIIYDKSMDLLLHTIFTNTINDVEQSFMKEEKINTKRPKPAHSTETQNEQQELFGTGSGTESEQKTEQASPDVSQSAHGPEQKEPEQVQEQTAASTETVSQSSESVENTAKERRINDPKMLNMLYEDGRSHGYYKSIDFDTFVKIHDAIPQPDLEKEPQFAFSSNNKNPNSEEWNRNDLIDGIATNPQALAYVLKNYQMPPMVFLHWSEGEQTGKRIEDWKSTFKFKLLNDANESLFAENIKYETENDGYEKTKFSLITSTPIADMNYTHVYTDRYDLGSEFHSIVGNLTRALPDSQDWINEISFYETSSTKRVEDAMKEGRRKYLNSLLENTDFGDYIKDRQTHDKIINGDYEIYHREFFTSRGIPEYPISIFHDSKFVYANDILQEIKQTNHATFHEVCVEIVKEMEEQEQTAARSAPSNTENTTKNPEQSVKSTFQSETKDEREQFYKYLNSFINTVVGRDNGYHNGETWYWNDKTAFNHIHDYINKNLKNVVVPVSKNGTERQLEFDDGIIKFRARDNDVYIKFVEDFLSCGKAKIEFSVTDESDIRLNRYMFDNIRPIFNDVCRQRLDEHLQEKHSHKNTSTSTPAPSVSRSESATTVSDPELEKSAARAETVSQSSETVPAADSTETVSQSLETVPAADSTETVGESESVNNEPVKKTYTASPIPPKPAPAPEVPYSEREFEDLDKSGNIKIDLNENRSDNEFYRFQKNIDAIRVVKQLNEENRDATPEEKETLRQFTGWGGLASRFKSYEGKVLKDLLTEQEYYDAVSSSATAYYTDPEIANLMYEKLEEMGLKGGTILEPSCGTGNFIGSVPENIRNKCKFVGVELDTITGQIAKHLYQSERVFNTGFENIKGENLFDAVIGNVPFDNCTVVDEDFKKENFSIHNYFIAKSLRLCKPGGVVALITSHNTLDSKSSLHREWIAQRGELLGAVRLPKDAFKHSGTSVVTDILFIKKRERMLTKEEARKEEWVNAKQVVMEYKKNSKTEEIERNKNGEPIVAEDVYINSYFADGNHAENVAGNIRFDKGKFGYEVFCEHKESDDKIELIKDSLKSISGTMEPIGKEQEISNASLLMNEKLMKIVDGLKDDEDKENIANYFVEDPNVKLDSFDPPLKSEKDYALFNSMTFMFLKDGSIRYHAGNGIFYKIEGAPKEDIETLTDIIKIRDIAKDYLNMQAEKRPEEELNNQQKLLNETYDRFCRKRGTDYITGKKKTHKHVNATLVGYRYNFTEHLDSDDKKNNTVEKNFTKLFSCDSQMSFIMALEKRGKYNRRAKTINKYGEYLGKSDIFTTRTVRETKEIEHVDSPQDALKVSMGYHGKVDFPYMAKLLGMKQNSESFDKIIESLKGEIFLEPDKLTILNKSIKFEDDTQDYIMDNTYKSYVIASEYLSGNVFQKIKRAEEMGLSENVNALMEVKPAYIKGEQIICDIGQNWIPADIYTKFVKEVIFPDCNNIKRDNDFRVEFNEFTNKVELLIPDKRAIKSEMAQSGSLSTTEYGTSNLHAGDILESLFNKHGLGLNVKKKIVDRETGRPVNVVDEVATKEVDIARQKIEKRFKEWLIEDSDRKEQIEKVYNERFNSNVPRKFDGKILNFDGMNPDIKLREHQIDAVARQIYGGNTLLHHEVGAGKTFEMIAAAMESKRIGVCSKPVIAVPPHLVKQTEEEFRRLYPNANLIVQTDNDNKLGNRQKFFANIAMSNCDCIIMSHNMFSKYLPMSKEYANNTFLKEYERLEVAYNEAEMREGKKGNTVKAIKEKIKKLEKRYKKFLDKNSNATDITFEETGIDRIFIDEAHIYKNLDTITTLSSLPGVCTNGNDATFDMKMKCEYLDRISDSKAITFATGTPVTNSMTEMFTMMRYLNQKGLDEQYIGDFDQWISIYGNIEEIKRINLLGTEFESRTELTNFKNTPELLTSYHMFADVKTEKDLQLPKPEAEFHTIATKPSSLQQEVIDTFVVRAETIKAGHVNPKVDNFLKLTHDGRQLGLDQRAYNPEFPDDPNSKVNACVENLIRIYNDTADQKSTQLVFCDQCTPKPKKKKVKEEEHEHKEEIIQNTSTERSSENEEDTELENPDERDVEIVNKFDVYADIKKKLIAGGVKEEEIAFIHDYNNADKKQELFDKVNKGEVRILLGSTAKMGAGTNVQKKLIALHHLDVTWKAADLTQRNGRALRQGNDNEKVDIYTYVTENTFDTYIFQKNQRKAEFMEQIMHNECHVREFDDIGELSLQCADIKACCLGDSRIREKVDLENELNKLELEQAAFKHTQAVVRDRVETLPKNIESHKKSIEKLNNDIDVLNKHPLPKNGFVGITISGVHYSERKDANAAILKEVKNFNFRDVKEKEIGSYRGFKVILSHKVSDNGDLPYIILQSSEKGARHGTTDLGAFESSDNMSRIENKLSKIPDQLELYKFSIEQKTKELEVYKSKIVDVWDKQEELEKVKADLIRVTNELEKDEQDDLDNDPNEVDTELESSVNPVEEFRQELKDSVSRNGIKELLEKNPELAEKVMGLMEKVERREQAQATPVPEQKQDESRTFRR